MTVELTEPSHPYDVLTLNNGAKLIFTPCPGTKGATLENSIASLKNAGASMLLTLMFDEEMIRHGVSTLPTECEKQAIRWVQLPIVDDAAPADVFEGQWQQQYQSILQVLNQQGTVAVHCKGGTGRTGLVIGLILLSLGWSSDKVIKEVQKIRPKSLKNIAQLNYLTAYAMSPLKG